MFKNWVLIAWRADNKPINPKNSYAYEAEFGKNNAVTRP